MMFFTYGKMKNNKQKTKQNQICQNLKMYLKEAPYKDFKQTMGKFINIMNNF